VFGGVALRFVVVKVEWRPAGEHHAANEADGATRLHDAEQCNSA
jgi:hypothetical protein